MMPRAPAKPVYTEEQRAQALAMLAAGMPGVAVAEAIGCHPNTVYHWRNGRGVGTIGGPTSRLATHCDCGNVRGRGNARCRDCANRESSAAATARHAETRDRLAALVRTGKPYRAIAEELGTTPRTIAVAVARLRRYGYDLPPRRQRRPRAPHEAG